MDSWERLPKETDKAWHAFCVYRDLPLHSPDKTNRRSIPNTAAIIGHKSPSTVEGWSRNNDWVARARARDAHLNKLTMTIKEQSLGELQESVIAQTILEIALLRKGIDDRLEHFAKHSDEYTIAEIQRIAKTLETVDNLARRIARLPTNFTSDTVEDSPQEIYIIGEINE